MACCKVCCGCKECDEGEEGKCCCGNECCAASTYCCNAECVSACSEGQEGDCKCSDACCYQDEYCCDGECVEACGEGGAGPCKCDSTCCDTGEYCCDGECQEEPCDECESPDPAVCESDSDCNYCVRTYPADGGVDTGGADLICPDGYVSVGLTPELRECQSVPFPFMGPDTCPCDPEPGEIEILDENSVSYTVSQGVEIVAGHCCDDGCSINVCPP